MVFASYAGNTAFKLLTLLAKGTAKEGKITSSIAKLITKDAKELFKQGKGNVEILDLLGKKHEIPMTRLKTSRGTSINVGRHQADAFLKKIIPTKQYDKRVSETITKKMETLHGSEKGPFKEEWRGKMSDVMRKRIREALRTGETNNSVIQQMIDYDGAAGTSAYARAQERFAKEWGGGSIEKLRSNENFLEAFHTRRGELQMIGQGLLDDFTPANQIFAKYGQQGWGNLNKGLIKERQRLTDLAFGKAGKDSEKLFKVLSEDLGLSKPQMLAGMGHQHPMAYLARLIAGPGKPNMSVMRAIQMLNKPENIKAELNFMNLGKRGIENYLYQKPLVSASELGDLNKLMKHGQVSSKFYGPTGTREQIGMPGREIDPKQLLDYLEIIKKDNPFGFTAAGNRRFLPIRKYIEALLEGKQKWNYQAGGLVGIGSKILAKLAKKLSEKEMKMILGSLWKGVDPKQSGRYKVWDKKRWGPGYKWPWKKSRIRGPEMKKSHYASLSDQAKEDLRKRYRKKIDEYIKRKRQDEEFYRHSEFWPNWPKKD